MEPGADFEAVRPQRVADRCRTADGACGPVEHGEDAVAGRPDLLPPEAAELRPHHLVVSRAKHALSVCEQSFRSAPLAVLNEPGSRKRKVARLELIVCHSNARRPALLIVVSLGQLTSGFQSANIPAGLGFHTQACMM